MYMQLHNMHLKTSNAHKPSSAGWSTRISLVAAAVEVTTHQGRVHAHTHTHLTHALISLAWQSSAEREERHDELELRTGIRLGNIIYYIIYNIIYYIIYYIIYSILYYIIYSILYSQLSRQLLPSTIFWCKIYQVEVIAEQKLVVQWPNIYDRVTDGWIKWSTEIAAEIFASEKSENSQYLMNQ